MTELSPQAQAVLDAFRAVPDLRDCPSIAAAALRAVADQLQFADDYGTRLINADDLLSIVTELENQ